MENAKIAILLATRNGGRYLRQQLDSLFFQEVQGWQLLVSDDGSTDDTPDILNEYSQKYPGRITLVPHEEPTGSAEVSAVTGVLAGCAAGLTGCLPPWLPVSSVPPLSSFSSFGIT